MGDDIISTSYSHSICPKDSFGVSSLLLSLLPAVAKIIITTISIMTPKAIAEPIIMFLFNSDILSVFNPPKSEFNSSEPIGLSSSILNILFIYIIFNYLIYIDIFINK